MTRRLTVMRAVGVVVAVTGLFWVTGLLASGIDPSEMLHTSVQALALADYSRDAGAPLGPLSTQLVNEVARDVSAAAHPTPAPGSSASPLPSPSSSSSGPTPTPSGTLPVPTPSGTLPIPTPTLPIPTPTLPTPTPTLPIPTPTLPVPTATPSLPIPGL